MSNPRVRNFLVGHALGSWFLGVTVTVGVIPTGGGGYAGGSNIRFICSFGVFFVFLFPLRPIFVLFFTRISTKADSGDDGSVACGVDVRWHQIRYHYHQVATYAKEAAASSHFFRADRELLSRVAQKEQRGAKGQVLPRKMKKVRRHSKEGLLRAPM